MKIFISCPFSGIMNKETNLVKEEYHSFFNTLTNFLKEKNIEYYLAIEREKWGETYISGEDSVKYDYKAIKESDALIVIPGSPISGGVHIELGWASVLSKKIYVFLDKNKSYSPVLMGLNELTNTKYFYSDMFPSVNLLNDIIKTIEKEIE